MPVKPEPIPKQIVCSACGLDWEKHPKRKTGVVEADCIKLLRAELARRPVYNWNGQIGGSTISIPSMQQL